MGISLDKYLLKVKSNPKLPTNDRGVIDLIDYYSQQAWLCLSMLDGIDSNDDRYQTVRTSLQDIYRTSTWYKTNTQPLNAPNTSSDIKSLPYLLSTKFPGLDISCDRKKALPNLLMDWQDYQAMVFWLGYALSSVKKSSMKLSLRSHKQKIEVIVRISLDDKKPNKNFGLNLQMLASICKKMSATTAVRNYKGQQNLKLVFERRQLAGLL